MQVWRDKEDAGRVKGRGMHGFLMQHEIRSREVHMGEFACQITSPPPFFSPRHHILSNIKEEVGLSACAHHHLLSVEKQGSALTLTGPPPLSFLQAYVNRCNFDLPASVQNHKMSPPPPGLYMLCSHLHVPHYHCG